mmetsp:Transcript_44908/g.40160  ORF Transcript_44908/g.40160 Transcript_44908/m.40160 type:complete len:149 (-) Transcript_44908:181-627(-)
MQSNDSLKYEGGTKLSQRKSKKLMWGYLLQLCSDKDTIIPETTVQILFDYFYRPPKQVSYQSIYAEMYDRYIVKTQYGKKISIHNAGPSTSILELKTRIEDKEGIRIKEQYLSFCGENLQNHQTIGYYGISPCAVISLRIWRHPASSG